MSEWFSGLNESAISLINSVEPVIAYFFIALASFLENIFPPAPGDLITVFSATLIANGHLHFVFVLISTTTGSVMGFMSYYYLGKWLGHKIHDKGFKFLPKAQFDKAELWFEHYGFKLILANRFLSGVRSVISLFCGISELEVHKVFFYATLSALAWNSILIYAGYELGQNWRNIELYMQSYFKFFVVFIVIALIIWFIIKKVKSKK
jgi:membrane protein DedA with SNARE-associated domain